MGSNRKSVNISKTDRSIVCSFVNTNFKNEKDFSIPVIATVENRKTRKLKRNHVNKHRMSILFSQCKMLCYGRLKALIIKWKSF